MSIGLEALRSGFSAGAVVDALDAMKDVVSKSLEFIVPPILVPALIKELYRWALIAPSIENDNLVDPNAGLDAFQAMIATASLLTALGVDEVVEILTEGIGEALSDAIRHIVTEPFEKTFSAYRGNREIDEDEIADAYSYGFVNPEVLGAMMIMNGYSSTSTMLMVGKSVGMLYQGDIRNVAGVIDALAARAMDYWLDPHETGIGMLRSVVNGLDELARTEADRILSELRQIAGKALDNVRDAYRSWYHAARLWNTNRARADAYLGTALGYLEEARAYLFAFDEIYERFAQELVPDVPDRVDELADEAYKAYLDAIVAYIRLLGAVAEPLMRFVAEIGVMAYEEVSRAMAEIARYRDYAPTITLPEVRREEAQPLNVVSVTVGRVA